MTHATTSLPVHASTELDIFDADQRTRVAAAAGIAATTPALNPRTLDILSRIEDAKRGMPAEVGSFLGHLGRLISAHGDADAVLGFALRALAKPPTPCPEYSWCTETGDHDEHTGGTIWATCPDAYGNPVLAVGLIDWGKGVKVGLLDLDLAPVEARAKVAELRTHLDHVERLIVLAEQGSTAPAADIEHARAGQ
ncbi:hypothetical protein [Streptomyces lavendulae]|uniref:hypothetical protein n=1 Tax=Streptomyces lavendulae TaxID=1914 RepID=UPI0031EA01A9